jgi:tetratricopeptide (TPR) repeat protein
MNKTKLLLAAVFTLIIGAIAVSAQTTPQTHDEFVQAGREAALKNDNKAASEWYSKALKVRPDNHDVRYARAATYYLIGKKSEAIKDLTIVLEALPGNLKVLYARASYYNANGDYKKGWQDGEAILKIDPDNAGGYQARGTGYAGQKKYKEALDDLSKSISLNPNDPGSYTVRAAVYEMQGNAAMAQADKLTAERLTKGM